MLTLSYPILIGTPVSPGLISQWCNRSANDTNFFNILPTCLQLAENYLFSNLQTLETELSSSGNLVIGQPSINIEDDWGKTLAFTIFTTNEFYIVEKASNEVVFLNQINQNNQQNNLPLSSLILQYCYTFQQSPSNPSGGIINLSFTPDKPYNYKIYYYSKPPALTQSVQSNIYTKNYGDLLFYLCLSNAYSYLSNFEKSLFYKTEADKLLIKYMVYNETRLLDRNSNLQSQLPVEGSSNVQ